MNVRSIALLVVLATAVATTFSACLSTNPDQPLRGGNTSSISGHSLGSQAHYDAVMTSRYCGTCHPVIYAEHELNTHGRAYTDKEVRLATGNFRTSDCIRCHTPRPIFETGIGHQSRCAATTTSKKATRA